MLENMSNFFIVSNKDTKATLLTSSVSILVIEQLNVCLDVIFGM